MKALLPNDPIARNASLVALLALLGAYLFHSYVRRPRLERVEALSLRIDRLAALRQESDSDLPPAAEDPERHLEAHSDHLSQLEALIPTSEEARALPEAISVEASRAGVELTTLRPEPREPGEVYDRWSYRVAASGRYHQIASFITAIASLHRIMIPSDVGIATEVASPAERVGAGAFLVASFKIHTFVDPGPRFNEGSGQPADEDSNLP